MTTTPAPDVGEDGFANWSPELRSELETHASNPLVGTRLLLEDARSRVWEIRLAPGERLAFHRHVLDYFWTCVSGGEAISHDGEGNVNTRSYAVSETRALTFGQGQSMIHDLVNAGNEDIVFTTVEFLHSANAPLPLAEEVCA
jgi:mannose-6-phosphate isomerase-like protein (cupin superfamily)